MADTMGSPVIAAFRKQVGWCETLGSPFTASVLAVLAQDMEGGGAMTAFLMAWPGDPAADALPLRVAGALHALVLTAASPALAAVYPPTNAPGLDEAVRTAMADHHAFIREFIGSPPQTNEVGRSAVLLGGFLAIAAATGRRMRLLEIGASAGLNLVWDRYRYRLGTVDWGDAASALAMAPTWEGPSPPVAELDVVERRGCDIAPIDLQDARQRLRLRAYIWADQPDRLDRVDRAMAIALAAGHRIERANAPDWVAARLRETGAGCTTVLYHSIMWQYMPEASRTAITHALLQAGARATEDAPLAWLRFEPPRPDARPELTLTLWPGGQQQTLAHASAHGSAVTWLAGGVATARPLC